MNTSQCAVYQVKDTPEYRDVRFRSYEKLKSEGRTVQVENYQQTKKALYIWNLFYLMGNIPSIP